MPSLSDSPLPVRPAGPPAEEIPSWKKALSEAIRDPAELCRMLGVRLPDGCEAASRDFGMLAPRGFVARMREGDPQDPLLLQVLPVGAESESRDLPTDAVGDLASVRDHGLLQKYHGRALMVLSGQCAVNCRYCFRRHFPYADLPQGDAAWEPALQSLAEDTSIKEVILSGGDPLVLSDRRLRSLIGQLDAIPHLTTLRIHTRLPVMIPERVTNPLCQTLSGSRLQTVFVTHINHANEIDDSVASATARLRDACDFLLNQSVLLRGINDSVESLESLSNRLLGIGIMPYYLHRLDLVSGVRHFEVPVETGERLIDALRARLPGYAVPRLVREEPGEPNKTVLA